MEITDSAVVYWFLLILGIYAYQRAAWACWMLLGTRLGRRTANLVDTFTSIAFGWWLWSMGHPVIMALGVLLWIKTNTDPAFQKHLEGLLEEARKPLGNKGKV